MLYGRTYATKGPRDRCSKDDLENAVGPTRKLEVIHKSTSTLPSVLNSGTETLAETRKNDVPKYLGVHLNASELGQLCLQFYLAAS